MVDLFHGGFIDTPKIFPSNPPQFSARDVPQKSPEVASVAVACFEDRLNAFCVQLGGKFWKGDNGGPLKVGKEGFLPVLVEWPDMANL